VISTLAVDGWTVTFDTTMRGLGGAATGRGRNPPRPLLAVQNVTSYPSTASVPTSYYSMWHYNCLWSLNAQRRYYELPNCHGVGHYWLAFLAGQSPTHPKPSVRGMPRNVPLGDGEKWCSIQEMDFRVRLCVGGNGAAVDVSGLRFTFIKQTLLYRRQARCCCNTGA